MRVEVVRNPVRVPGFRFAGVACGLKESGKRDVALIVADRPAVAAGAFTTNRVQAAPVVIGRQRLARGLVQAILVNSGNANAYTGRDGEALARELTGLVAERLGIDERLVVPSSTGRIGVPLPRARVRRGVLAATRALHADGFFDALEGMMTTDAFPKFAVERLRLDGRPVTVAGLAKGAGMIAPHMATLLVYVLTDACVTGAALRRLLAAALPLSFNAIVVDGDMSTNDTVLVLANGAPGNRPLTTRSRRIRVPSPSAVTRLMRGAGAHDRQGRRRRDQGDRHRRAWRAQHRRRGAGGRRHRPLAAVQDGLLRRRSIRRAHRVRRRLQRRACSTRHKLDVFLDARTDRAPRGGGRGRGRAPGRPRRRARRSSR